jgi:hypothetical protein
MIKVKEPKTGTKNGEIRYFIFYSPYSKKITLKKVKCLRKRWDPLNGNFVWDCKIIKTFMGENNNKTTVDYLWQLRTTLEDAYKTFFIVLLNYGTEIFYEVLP